MHQKYEEERRTNWFPMPWQVEAQKTPNPSWLNSFWVGLIGPLMLIGYYIYKTLLFTTGALIVAHVVRIVMVGVYVLIASGRTFLYGLFGYARGDFNSFDESKALVVQKLRQHIVDNAQNRDGQ